MGRRITLAAVVGLASALLFTLTHASRTLAAQAPPNRRVLITETIDGNKLVTLAGNTRPEANARNDRGRVEDSFPMEHMLLQLKRPPELEQALDQYIQELTDKTSPNYHRWLTPVQLGELYGPSQTDLLTVQGWLESHGFVVGKVYPNGMVIDFSGTAGEIREAFHTEIHYLDVNNQRHFANMSDPKIPAALAPIIVGVVSMNNFKPQSMAVPRVNYSFGCTSPLTSSCNALVPSDIQTIYNINPLYAENILGQGQTIIVVQDSDTYGNDVATYRSTFLSQYSGTVETTHPTGANNCTDPDTNGADSEADIDAEIASAVAPDATIEVATCKDATSGTFGGLLAVENIVNAGTPATPTVLSMSYGECEVVSGSAYNAAFNSAFQTAAANSFAVFVSAGDTGATSCARNFGTDGTYYGLSGIGVTGWGETVYNVSVGGTDFEDVYNAQDLANGGEPLSTYWASTNNPISYGSAKAYVPEIPWNDSCASWLIMSFESYTAPYGSTGFCNNTSDCSATTFLCTAAGGGGPSGCATGSATGDSGIVNSTCAGYAKPSWQSSVYGNPADGVRDVPDVSLFAANGTWGHYVVICFSDSSNGGTSCSHAPDTWSGFGGTSVASPMMAAIQALVNQKTGAAQGNPVSIYYQIAGAEFGASGNPDCYSANQVVRRGLSTACVFYDITQGDNNVDCEFNGSIEEGCYAPLGTYGIISTQAITSATVTAGGSGYTTPPTCTFAYPTNYDQTPPYLSPTGSTIYSGGSQAACTAAISSSTHKVTSITVTNGGAGYQGNPICSLNGGGGTGATCVGHISDTTAAPSYQPAFFATPGWDFATGLGSVNAYNLAYSSAW